MAWITDKQEDEILDWYKRQCATTSTKLKEYVAYLRDQDYFGNIQKKIDASNENSDKIREDIRALFMRAQEHDEAEKVRRGSGWKLFKRVVGTVLKDGEDLIK
jgi:hypothetical protein